MKVHPKKKFILDVYGKEPSTLDELAECCIAVCNESEGTWSRQKNKKKKNKVLGFVWDVRHGNVSNTHYAPINGVTNWGGRDEYSPRSYPGWSGRLWIRYEDEYSSDPIGRTLTHTGTGGWGTYGGPWTLILRKWHNTYSRSRKTGTEVIQEPKCYSWDYRFFDQDWPLIEEWVAKNNTFSLIKNGKPWVHHHLFSWIDPETALMDEQFLKEVE